MIRGLSGQRGLVALRRRFMLAMALIGGAMLIGLTAVTVVDVAGRYLFNHPLNGASEMTEFLLLGVIFLGIPAITLDDEHLSVELLTERLRGPARALHRQAMRLVIGGFFAVTGWLVLQHADRLAVYGEATIYLGVPYAPVARIAGGLLIVSGLIALGLVVHAARRDRRPGAPGQ